MDKIAFICLYTFVTKQHTSVNSDIVSSSSRKHSHLKSIPSFNKSLLFATGTIIRHSNHFNPGPSKIIKLHPHPSRKSLPFPAKHRAPNARVRVNTAPSRKFAGVNIDQDRPSSPLIPGEFPAYTYAGSCVGALQPRSAGRACKFNQEGCGGPPGPRGLSRLRFNRNRACRGSKKGSARVVRRIDKSPPREFAANSIGKRRVSRRRVPKTRARVS